MLFKLGTSSESLSQSSGKVRPRIWNTEWESYHLFIAGAARWSSHMCPLSWKEGNSMPVHSSQWVGISSLVIGNSVVSLLHSISKSWQHYSILKPFFYPLRRLSDVGLVLDQACQSLNLPSISITLLLLQSLPPRTAFSVLKFQQGFWFREQAPLTQSPQGTYPSTFLLAPHFCPSIILLWALYR